MCAAGDLIVYNALTLAVLNVIKAHSSPVAALAISHCGTRIATASEKVLPHLRSRRRHVLVVEMGHIS